VTTLPARFRDLMPRTLFLSLLATLPLATALQGQSASPYVPLAYWGMPYVEYFIARRALVDPAPLSRPLRAGDLVSALGAMDTVALSAAERAVVRRIVADLSTREQGPVGRVEGHLSGAAATHALRDPLEIGRGPGMPSRAAGPTRGFVSGGLDLRLGFGPIILVTHPVFDTRLKFDPDYEGKKDRAIAGRNAEAYLSAQWRYAEVFFGSLDRNWGPPAVQSLLLSPAPYSYDHFALSVGTRGLRLEALLTQLDDVNDTLGIPQHRYFVAHRLVLHPPGRTSVALWEGEVLAGPGRQLEPWYANVLNLGLLAQYDQGSPGNSLVGFDVQTGAGGATFFASALLDDIQVDRGGGASSGNNEPSSYGVTIGAQGALGPGSWTAFYTRVANLTYRTPNPAEAVERRGVGLGRNFSDYDQLTLRGSLLTAPGVLLTPEVTLLRQGEGDFRLPYPPVAAYDTTPAFLAGTLERTLRLALGGRFDRRRWSLVGDGGVHLVRNAGHVQGASETRWVGSVQFTWRFQGEHVLP
jgi:hypothetical protein